MYQRKNAKFMAWVLKNSLQIVQDPGRIGVAWEHWVMYLLNHAFIHHQGESFDQCLLLGNKGGQLQCFLELQLSVAEHRKRQLQAFS